MKESQGFGGGSFSSPQGTDSHPPPLDEVSQGGMPSIIIFVALLQPPVES